MGRDVPNEDSAVVEEFFIGISIQLNFKQTIANPGLTQMLLD